MPDGGGSLVVETHFKSTIYDWGSRSRRYIRSCTSQVMRKINHENCVRFYEAMEDARYLYLSMELCTGDFFEYLTKLSGKKHSVKKSG